MQRNHRKVRKKVKRLMQKRKEKIVNVGWKKGDEIIYSCYNEYTGIFHNYEAKVIDVYPSVLNDNLNEMSIAYFDSDGDYCIEHSLSVNDLFIRKIKG